MSTKNNSKEIKEDISKSTHKTTTRDEELDPSNTDELVKIPTHKLPTSFRLHKFVADETGKTETFCKSKLELKEILFFKNCKDCTFNVESTCTKVMIEDCENLKITFSSKILTNVLEIWKCNNIDIHCDTEIFTIQLDVCKGVKLTFSDINFYHQVVWANVHDIDIEFTEHPEHNLSTGFEHVMKEYDDINENLDQFIIRFLNGKLLSELIVRLSNGFPTTNREADDFDERHQKIETYQPNKQIINMTM